MAMIWWAMASLLEGKDGENVDYIKYTLLSQMILGENVHYIKYTFISQMIGGGGCITLNIGLHPYLKWWGGVHYIKHTLISQMIRGGGGALHETYTPISNDWGEKLFVTLIFIVFVFSIRLLIYVPSSFVLFS